MARFKKKPKQKSAYTGILTTAEEQRKSWRQNIQKFKPSGFKAPAKGQVVKNIQRFSGKKGN